MGPVEEAKYEETERNLEVDDTDLNHDKNDLKDKEPTKDSDPKDAAPKDGDARDMDVKNANEKDGDPKEIDKN